MVPMVFCSDHAVSGEAAPKSKNEKVFLSIISKTIFHTAMKFSPSFLFSFHYFFNLYICFLLKKILVRHMGWCGDPDVTEAGAARLPDGG